MLVFHKVKICKKKSVYSYLSKIPSRYCYNLFFSWRLRHYLLCVWNYKCGFRILAKFKDSVCLSVKKRVIIVNLSPKVFDKLRGRCKNIQTLNAQFLRNILFAVELMDYFLLLSFTKTINERGGGIIEWDDFFLEGVLLFENNYVTKFGFLQLIFLLVSNNKYRVL